MSFLFLLFLQLNDELPSVTNYMHHLITIKSLNCRFYSLFELF